MDFNTLTNQLCMIIKKKMIYLNHIFMTSYHNHLLLIKFKFIPIKRFYIFFITLLYVR